MTQTLRRELRIKFEEILEDYCQDNPTGETEMTETLNPVTVRPIELKPGDVLGYKIVAVIGYGGDWAAYAGLTNWTDEEVKDGGDKLGQDVAELLFYAPKAAGLEYRG